MAEFYLVPKRLARAAPALGRMTQKLEACCVGLVFRLLGRLSPERAASLAAAVFRCLGPFSNKAKAVKRNLRVIYPEAGERHIRQLCRQTFGYLGVATAELVKLPQIWRERKQRIEFEVSPAARSRLQPGRANVFVTAHVGAWQLTNLIFRQYGMTVSTVYAAESNAFLQRHLLRLRTSFGSKLVASEEGVRPLYRELTAGNSIGLATDTRLDSGQPIPFFGVDAYTNISAARLALKTGAALIPVRAGRLEPGRFFIRVHDPIDNPDPEADIRSQAIAMTTLVNRHFEQWIREAPEQWMCLKRRWPKDCSSRPRRGGA